MVAFLTENWQTETEELFDSVSLGLIYTLAALFLATTLFGTKQMAVAVRAQIFSKNPINMVFWLIFFIWAFQLGRAMNELTIY
jgi:hypothetical protein